MKLYTEEQVRQMLEVGRDFNLYENLLTFDDIIATQTPIELPSDEEIMKEASKSGILASYKAFLVGAKWMREKLLTFKSE